MKYLLLVMCLIAFLVTPQLAYSACQTITIMQDGQMKVCQVCTVGNQTIVNCF